MFRDKQSSKGSVGSWTSRRGAKRRLVALFVPLLALSFTMSAAAASPSASAGKGKLELVKSSNISRYLTAGTVITYTFRVTNVGTQTVTNILVADPMVGLSPISCVPNTNPIASLAPFGDMFRPTTR